MLLHERVRRFQILDNRIKGAITPLHQLSFSYDSNEIYIKRDDLLPFCFGGNKARIAYVFLGDMIRRGMTCMVGYGSLKSNLSRALACACSSAGFRCVIITPLDSGETLAMDSFNSKMVRSLGAEVVYCEKTAVKKTVSQTLHRLRTEGEAPYYIYGDESGAGNKLIPPEAYSGFWPEVTMQAQALGVRFDRVFLPVGTGMTMSGIIAGMVAAGSNVPVIGISVARPAEIVEEHVRSYLDSYSIEHIAAAFPWAVWDQALAGGYGDSTPEEDSRIAEVFANDGIPMDRTYVGKGFAGMLKWLSGNSVHGERLLFVHTGGTPLFFDDYLTKG